MFLGLIPDLKYKKKDFLLWVILFSALLLLILVAFAHANPNSPQDIEVSPSSTELSAPPGGSAHGSLTVINGGNSNFNVDAYAESYYVTGVNYNPTFMLLPGKTDASKWIQILGNPQALIAASKSDSFDYTLSVPKNTAPGGYYAVLFAETQPAAGGGILSRSRVGDILYITVQGPVTQNGSLLAVKPPKIVIGSSLTLATEVADTGGLHFITTANIKLVNALTHSVVYSDSLQRYVLPQTIRKISATILSTPLIGLYKVEVSADILGKTPTLPSQWVFIIHPVVLFFVPVIVILIVVYFKLPKGKSKKKAKSRS